MNNVNKVTMDAIEWKDDFSGKSDFSPGWIEDDGVHIFVEDDGELILFKHVWSCRRWMLRNMKRIRAELRLIGRVPAKWSSKPGRK